MYRRYPSFRPLTGIVVLIDKLRAKLLANTVAGFRPLPGIVVLIITGTADDYKKDKKSFRPLTGIVVLISFLFYTYTCVCVVFPSPYGDCGSYLSFPCSLVRL